MSGWPTPMAGTPAQNGNNDSSRKTVALSGWPSPTVGNAAGSQMAKDASTTGRRPDGSKATVSLNAVAHASGWPTPEAEEARRGYQNRSNGKKGSQESMTTAVINALGDKPHLTPHGAARITADGTMLTGCSAGMESGGQLNPAFSGWLQGFPEAWCHAAISCQLPARLRKRPVA